jgi:hypothetical protein
VGLVRATIVILCEDILHDCFVRYVLGIGGRDRELRISPRADGSAEQWVREQFAREVRAIRSCGRKAILVVVTDADKNSVEDRRESLLKSLDKAEVERPKEDEGIFILIPKWEIETWLKYLEDGVFNEEDGKLPKRFSGSESNCDPLAQKLLKMCQSQKLEPEPAPPSLLAACVEYKRFKKFLG